MHIDYASTARAWASLAGADKILLQFFTLHGADGFFNDIIEFIRHFIYYVSRCHDLVGIHFAFLTAHPADIELVGALVFTVSGFSAAITHSRGAILSMLTVDC